jgi:Uma2 family endonuclease
MATTAGPKTGRKLYRFTIEQVDAMIRAGILPEDGRTEMLEGVIYWEMPKNTPHMVSLSRLCKFLYRVVPDGFTVMPEPTIAIPWPGRPTRGSLPEPDAIITMGDPDSYDRRIEPGDIAIVFEVADTSLREDRTGKKRRYARAPIPVYWLINLHDRQVEVYSDPSGPGRSPDYRTTTSFAEDQEVPLVLAGREVGRIVVRELLPRPTP